jgi:mRNA interferase RelE/StbE
MAYSVGVERKAQKQIARLSSEMQDRIEAALGALAYDPRPPGCRKLHDREGWRIRIGDYRVVYLVDDDRLTVTILLVAHRRDVYRRG